MITPAKAKQLAHEIEEYWLNHFVTVEAAALAVFDQHFEPRSEGRSA